MKKVIVDTTVQEKAITHPTDAKLYNVGRRWLVRLAKEHGLALRQSYERLGKKALFQSNCYARAQQEKSQKEDEAIKNLFRPSLSRYFATIGKERRFKTLFF